jgi:rRNA maturation endonuclease Nob1
VAKWVLQCPKCKTEFEHSQISELGMSLLLLPDKPAFTRNASVCPSCGQGAVYRRTDLMYRI